MWQSETIRGKLYKRSIKRRQVCTKQLYACLPQLRLDASVGAEKRKRIPQASDDGGRIGCERHGDEFRCGWDSGQSHVNGRKERKVRHGSKQRTKSHTETTESTQLLPTAPAGTEGSAWEMRWECGSTPWK